MPKAQIVCQTCNWTCDGDVPDGRSIGWNYKIGGALERIIKQHHKVTRQETGVSAGFLGHRDFDVFLVGGRTGQIIGNSYQVRYKELPPEDAGLRRGGAERF